MLFRAALLSLAVLSPTLVQAGPPEVLATTAERSGMGWRIEVTIRHTDTGWDHFANGWAIFDEAGRQIAYRRLHHPHVNEQPFTRSMPSVMIPDGTRRVFVQAYCSRDGSKSRKFELRLEP